eukprot:XP_017945595.1 PREDICTED: receptor-type tyrosine-protein phosphatase kappa-like [Xenopus tropicalis]
MSISPSISYEIIVSGGWNGSLRQLCTSYTSTRYNSSQVPTLYTAVLLPAVKLTKSRTFTLGDGLYYDGFFNSPMSPDWNYKVYLRVTSKWKEVEKASCTCLDPYVVSLKLEITGVPSPTETVLQWRRVGGSRRDITGYQILQLKALLLDMGRFRCCWVLVPTLMNTALPNTGSNVFMLQFRVP